MNRDAFNASAATLLYVCDVKDPVAAECLQELKDRAIKAKQFEGCLYVAKNPQGPDVIYDPPPVLPTVTDLAGVLAFGRAQGWWK